jgi:sulfite reductase (ferredoxin)
MGVTKETRAQRVERLKREKNPWECMEEIRSFARNGHTSIPPEWLGTYLRPWGIYTQGDGNGVVGGKGGEGAASPFFMVRVRVPGGHLNAGQVRTIADLADRHGCGMADITVRQNVQLHWVTIQELPGLLDRLHEAGLTTIGTCGDVVRNITGCPLAGLDGHEVCDASPLLRDLDGQLGGNGRFYNLPRKFKVSVTGCRVWCTYPEINDVGLTATTRRRGGSEEVGFSLRVGGGLSTRPHLAVRLDAFVKWNEVVPVVRGIAEIFRENERLREDRSRARLKFLFLEHGWTAESFLLEIERRIGITLDPAEGEEAPDDVHRDHVGVHRQKQQGLSYVGASIPQGRITATQLRALADLSERFGSKDIRTTTGQNILLVGIRDENAKDVVVGLEAAGLEIGGSSFARGIVACTGSEFCRLALAETKGFARWLTVELDERLPGFDEELKLHITGCPKSCGQHWIADIGLQGGKVRLGARMADAYELYVGGAVGRRQLLARPIGIRCAREDVPDTIERLLIRYRADRAPTESFRDYVARQSDGEIRSLLAGGVTGSVPGDLFAAAPLHGTER